MPMTDEERIAVLDHILEEVGRLRGDIAAIRADLTEPSATVHTMTVGGWMQRPGSPRWLPIAAITECGTPANCWRIDFDLKSTDPDGSFIHVDGHTAFPFLTAEQFDRDCAREQDDAFPVARLVEDQAAIEARAERELQAERARDFGHDDPAAA